MMRRARRMQRFEHQPRAFGRQGRKIRRRPCGDVPRTDADPLDQPGHAELRVGRLKGGTQAVVGFHIQAGKDDAPLGQIGDGVQQLRRRRDAARRTRGDDRGVGRIVPPGSRLRGQQAISAIGGVDTALGGQHLGPLRAQDIQKLQRDLPMSRELRRNQIGQRTKAKPFGMNLIEKSAQFRRQMNRLFGRPTASATRQDHAGEQDLTAKPRYHRRNFAQSVRPATGKLGRTKIGGIGYGQFVLVHVAQGHKAGKKDRPPVAAA